MYLAAAVKHVSGLLCIALFDVNAYSNRLNSTVFQGEQFRKVYRL